MRWHRAKTKTLTVFLWGVLRSLQSLRPDVRHRVFSNQKRLDDFLASQDVTAQRLHYSGSLTNVLNPGPLSSYDKGQPPVPVAPAQAREIQQLLQQPSSYPLGRRECLFSQLRRLADVPHGSAYDPNCPLL